MILSFTAASAITAGKVSMIGYDIALAELKARSLADFAVSMTFGLYLALAVVVASLN